MLFNGFRRQVRLAPAGTEWAPRLGRSSSSARGVACARASVSQDAAPFRCEACGFLYFFNPAVAVAALILRDDGKALFIRRAKDPAKGRLALVGGFVDAGESAEHALRREVREEVQLELDQLRFLSSHPNDYHYQDIAYPVVDFVFVARTPDHDRAVGARRRGQLRVARSARGRPRGARVPVDARRR